MEPLTFEEFGTLARLLGRFERNHVPSDEHAVVTATQQKVREIYCDLYISSGEPDEDSRGRTGYDLIDTAAVLMKARDEQRRIAGRARDHTTIRLHRFKIMRESMQIRAAHFPDVKPPSRSVVMRGVMLQDYDEALDEHLVRGFTS